MDDLTFETIIAEEFERIPQKWKARLSNVVLLAEDEPSAAVREAEGLAPDETLLGLYYGVPHTARGEGYGVGDLILPDTITIYRLPTLDEAGSDDPEAVRKVVRETLWHEIAHHFGFEEDAVMHREQEGSNKYRGDEPTS
jgi:predicted Zn-dependent protease with MMP-like domain